MNSNSRSSSVEAHNLPSDEEVMSVHRNAYPIDLHLDSLNLSLFAGFDFWKGDWKARKNRLLLWVIWVLFPKGENFPLFYHVSAKDLLKGQYGGACATAHAYSANLLRLPFIDPWKKWLAHERFVKDVVCKSGGKFRITKNPSEVRAAKSAGAVSIIFCVEGAHVLGRFGQRTRSLRLARVRTLSEAGSAYLTLNHYCNTDISEAGYRPLNAWRKTKDGRLSEYGHQFVQACIDAGLLIDLTHTSTPGILSVCEQCIENNVPVVVSHGASRSITSGDEISPSRHLERTLETCAIRRIVETGGCISIILAPYFLRHSFKPDGSQNKDADLEFVVRYYEQLAGLIDSMKIGVNPWKHLSFGSDFDGGISSIPIGMSSGSDLPELTRAMLVAGWPVQRIRDVYSENFLRCWDQALANRQ